MSFTVVIPARYGSSRLPGKPLANIAGKPMIERVYNCALKSSASRVVVATDDARVEAAVRAFGGRVCMTSADHQSGTDRLQEVAAKLALGDDEILVNVQGDEPLIPASVINQVADNLMRESAASCATLAEAIAARDEVFNANTVKVVADDADMALYFSRAPIPWDRDGYAAPGNATANALSRRHIGIYAYRVALLKKFVQWPVASLEAVEKLEQLRILANGHRIHVATAVEEVPGGVDTAADLERVRALFSAPA